MQHAKHPETEPTLQAPWLPSQRGKPVIAENHHGAEEEGHFAFGGDRRICSAGEHPSVATCCLTFELSRERRCGA